jgi:hypothetical protein
VHVGGGRAIDQQAEQFRTTVEADRIGRSAIGGSDAFLLAEVRRMLDAGLYGEALSDWTTYHDGASAVLVNFTNVDSEKTAENLAERILELL